MLRAPFPWFGGKSRVAGEVWDAFGDVANYVEPFFGSGAVLLGRSDLGGLETVNDRDGFVANFWRAVVGSPDEVAVWAEWPVNENDLHARHIWLVGQADGLVARLEGDPEWYDPKVAGWWVWGLSCWIGGGFCSGDGPWSSVDGRLERVENAGRGVRRRRVHLNGGQGVQRQLVHREAVGLRSWFRALAERLSRVRVCSGDWSRVCGPTPTFVQGVTGVFLDPPYPESADRDANIYRVDDLSVAADVRDWAVEAGGRPDMRIALCGYEGSLSMPADWRVFAWRAAGGYENRGTGSGAGNRHRERIWFSPACRSPRQGLLL